MHSEGWRSEKGGSPSSTCGTAGYCTRVSERRTVPLSLPPFLSLSSLSPPLSSSYLPRHAPPHDMRRCVSLRVKSACGSPGRL